VKIDDRLSGILFVLLGSLIIYWAKDLPTLRHIQYGPGFFPTLIGIGFVAGGGVLVIRRLLALRKLATGTRLVALGAWCRSPRHVGGVVLTLGALVFYILVVQRLGFLLTMPVILGVLIGWWHRRWLTALVVALLATVCLQVFFQQLLTVPLPWGALEPYAGVLTWK
jgi:putative tricarboxylic transport membrane protein